MRLIERHVALLWSQDRAGILLHTNEPEPDIAPRLYLGRDVAGVVLRIGSRLPAALRAAGGALDPALLWAEPGRAVAWLAQDWPCLRTWRGPAYVLPDSVDSLPHGAARPLGTHDLARLERFTPGNAAACLLGLPVCGVVVGDELRSLCFSSRLGELACEAGVETAPAWRGRGYGRQAVLCWAREVRRQGKLPLYSTSWDNAASRALARSIGAEPYGEDREYF